MNEFPEIAVLWNVRAGLEPALDSFDILSASVYVKLPFSGGRQPPVLPIEHIAHHALIIGSVRKANLRRELVRFHLGIIRVHTFTPPRLRAV